MRIDMEQARKRARELVRQGIAPRLADAQRQVARSLGYPSWPALVHAVERPTAARVVEAAAERGELALELLDAAPALRADPWVALSLGDVAHVTDPRGRGGPLSAPPLFYVARSRIAADTVAAARALIARGADPNAPGHQGWSNLSSACWRGDAPLVALLLEAGALVDDGDSLYHATEPADPACLRLLLAQGATPAGTNALAHALDYERPEAVRLLLEHGADPNEHDGHWPELHHAVRRRRSPAMLELLFAHGARPDVRDAKGRTAYQWAVRLGLDETAAVLAAHGVPTVLEPADRSLAALATGGGDGTALALDDDTADAVVELAMRDTETLGRVVDAAGPGLWGRWGGGPRGTLLHQASWFGRPELVALLLGRGADPNARAETAWATPLGWAAVGSRYTPDHPDDTFSSPGGDFVAVAELLVAAGAAIERHDAEMAVSPLREWLEAH